MFDLLAAIQAEVLAKQAVNLSTYLFDARLLASGNDNGWSRILRVYKKSLQRVSRRTDKLNEVFATNISIDTQKPT